MQVTLIYHSSFWNGFSLTASNFCQNLCSHTSYSMTRLVFPFHPTGPLIQQITLLKSQVSSNRIPSSHTSSDLLSQSFPPHIPGPLLNHHQPLHTTLSFHLFPTHTKKINNPSSWSRDSPALWIHVMFTVLWPLLYSRTQILPCQVSMFIQLERSESASFVRHLNSPNCSCSNLSLVARGTRPHISSGLTVAFWTSPTTN